MALGAATGARSGIIEEGTTGLFIEGNAATEFLGHDFRINAGVRYITTDQTISSPTQNPPAPPNIANISLDSDYDAFLPAFNMVVGVTDNIQLRMSASRTLTRPDPSQMLPGTVFTDPTAQGATQGNPNLTPFLSNNFDIGGEWYTGAEGYIGLALFRKEITGFTRQGVNTIPFNQLGIPFSSLTPTQQVSINNRGGPDVATVTVTQQVNIDSVLTIDGLEVNWVQPLTFVLDGLGFMANYTKINHSSKDASVVPLGVAPQSYNVTGYYENYGFSMRVSYNWSDAQTISGPNQNSVPVAALKADARGQWDLSASYELGEIWDVDWAPQIVFDVTNFTNEPQRQTFQYDNAAFTYYEQGTFYQLGIRGRF